MTYTRDETIKLLREIGNTIEYGIIRLAERDEQYSEHFKDACDNLHHLLKEYDENVDCNSSFDADSIIKIANNKKLGTTERSDKLYRELCWILVLGLQAA